MNSFEQRPATRYPNLDRISIVEKLDDARKNFNKRVLKSEDGLLMYYSKVPKQFEQTNPKLIGDPKGGVNYSDIHDIFDAEPNIFKDLQQKMIIIMFDQAALLDARAIKKYQQSRLESHGLGESQLENSSQQQKPEEKAITASKVKVRWAFLFESTEARSRWANTLANNFLTYGKPPWSEEMRRFIDSQAVITRQTVLPSQLATLLSNNQNQLIQEQEEKIETKDVPEENVLVQQKLKQKDIFENLKKETYILGKQRLKQEEEKLEQKKRQREEEERIKNQQREEEERKKREEEQRQQRQEQERQMTLKVQTAWEFRYFQALEDYIDMTKRKDFEETMKSGIKVVKLVETFRVQASKVVKEIIHELLEMELRKKNIDLQEQNKLNEEQNQKNLQKQKKKGVFYQRTEKQVKDKTVEVYQETLNDIKDGQYVFQRKNMLVKIACGDFHEERVLYVSQKSNFYKANSHKFDAKFYPWGEDCFFVTSVQGKSHLRDLYNEFKAMSYINDYCIMARIEEESFRINVPLACLVQYMGFTALVIARPPCSMDDTSLAYGPSSVDGSYRASTRVQDNVISLGKYMSIKPHHFVWNIKEAKRRLAEERRQTISLSYFTEIHMGKFEEFEHLKAMLKVYNEEEALKFDQRKQVVFYLSKVQDTIPFYIEDRLAEIIDMMNTSRLLLDEQYAQLFEQAIINFPHYRIRPEFLKVYFKSGIKNDVLETKLQYNPDCYDTQQDLVEVHDDQLKLAEMSRYLSQTYLVEFTRKLDSLELFPLDSSSLRDVLKIFGINCRMLGELARITQQPHIRGLFEVEMIARAIKNIFINQISEEVLQIKEEDIPYKQTDIRNIVQAQNLTDPEDIELQIRPTRAQFRRQSTAVQIKQQTERIPINEYLELMYKDFLADFLNLIFSPLSAQIWEQVIAKQILNDFDYDLEVKIKGIHPGALLNAIMYNLKVEINFEPMHIYNSTPYASFPKQEIIQKFKLKHLLHSKSYQLFFNNIFTSPTQNQGTTPLTSTSRNKSKQSLHSKPDEAISSKVDNFFNSQDIIKVHQSVQTYSLDELEVIKLTSKYEHFKNRQNWSLAIKSLNMKLTLISSLTPMQSQNLSSSAIFSESALLYLRQGDIQQCIMRVCQALNQISQQIVIPNSTGKNENCISFLNQLTRVRILPKTAMIKPLMILLEAIVESSPWDKYTLDIFDMILFNIEFSLGPQHPLFSQVFKFMAYFFTKLGKFEDAKAMHQNQVLCLIQSVGQRHQSTGDAYFEMGLFIQEVLEIKEESLFHYERAFLIYETVFGLNSIQCAKVSYQLAQVLSSCGKSKEALEHCERALKCKEFIEGENLIIFKLKYLRTLQLQKLQLVTQAKKEAEDFIKLVQQQYFSQLPEEENIDVSPGYRQTNSFQQEKPIYKEPLTFGDFVENIQSQQNLDEQSIINQDLAQLIQQELRLFTELYLNETNNQHRNFLYQVSDQIKENLARDGLLEKISDQNTQTKALIKVLKRIKKLGSIESFQEKIMVNFIESTGGDANKFIFNFKKLSGNSGNFLEAIEDYEHFIIAIGYTYISNIFNKLSMQ